MILLNILNFTDKVLIQNSPKIISLHLIGEKRKFVIIFYTLFVYRICFIQKGEKINNKHLLIHCMHNSTFFILKLFYANQFILLIFLYSISLEWTFHVIEIHIFVVTITFDNLFVCLKGLIFQHFLSHSIMLLSI